MNTGREQQHLFYDGPAWHVTADPSFGASLQALSLRQVKRLELLDRSLTAHFDARKHIGTVWSMLPRATLRNVRLRFSPSISKDVSKTQWHSTQRISFQNDGTAIIEFYADGFRDMVWWILSYGDAVQVLEPEDLRQRITAMARELRRLHM